MSEIAIEATGISKQYRIGAQQAAYKSLRESVTDTMVGPFRRLGKPRDAHKSNRYELMWALRDVSFQIKPGEVVGVIGRNGAGKSTLLKVLSRITDPTEGRVAIHGRVGSLLEVGTGFHEELTGRENIYLNGAILGMRKAEIESKFDEIVHFAEVERFIDTPVKHYSSGMHMRLAFSVAAHLEPEILLVDEVLAVGDMAFQQKCLGKMGEVVQEGRTVLFVSHNMGAVRSLCKTGLVISHGKVVEQSNIASAIETYHRLVTSQQGEEKAVGAADRKRTGFGPISLPAHSTNSISQSEGFEVATTLHVVNDVIGFTLFCNLQDMHGRHIFQLREESSVLGIKDCKNGSYNIRLQIPPLWLVPGLYSLQFKVVFLGEFASAHHVSDTFSIDVDGENSQTEAVLHPDGDWKVQYQQ